MPHVAIDASLPDMKAAVGFRSPSQDRWNVSTSAVRVTSVSSSRRARAGAVDDDGALALDHELGGSVLEAPPSIFSLRASTAWVITSLIVFSSSVSNAGV